MPKLNKAGGRHDCRNAAIGVEFDKAVKYTYSLLILNWNPGPQGLRTVDTLRLGEPGHS
jgi:hypothetical protein